MSNSMQAALWSAFYAAGRQQALQAPVEEIGLAEAAGAVVTFCVILAAVMFFTTRD
jgi:hypothetical protein